MIALNVPLSELLGVIRNLTPEEVEEFVCQHLICEEELLSAIAITLDHWCVRVKDNLVDYENRTHSLGYKKEQLKIELEKLLKDEVWENE